MSIKLDDWQEDVLAHKGNVLLCTGRRVGKTYILARKGIDKMAQKKGLPIVIISLTEDQAMIIMSMALNYAKDTYPKLLGRGKFKPTMRSLYLNGGKMLVRPAGATGDGARGFEGGILIVDEASRMPKMFWMAAKPLILTTSGEIWMASTPFGKQGYYWDRYNEVVNKKKKNSRFKVFYITTEDVMQNRPISESWTLQQREGALQILADEKEEMSELEYGQEFLGLFLDELRQFFSDELIEACSIISKDNIPRFPEVRNYLGVDVSRLGGDETVLCNIAKNDNTQYMFDLDVSKYNRIPDTAERIRAADSRNDYRKIGIDTGGVGGGVYDILLLLDQTKRKIVDIDNAKKDLEYRGSDTKRRKGINKEMLYYNLLRLMEQGAIKLFDSPEVRLSLRSVQCEVKGVQQKFFGRDTHIAEALVRAAWVADKDKSLNIWIR